MRPRNPRELRAGLGATLRFRPAERWASVTGLVKAPDGSTVEEPTPTVDSVDTTIASYASATEYSIQVADATGIERGREYIVTDAAFGTAIVEVSSVDSVTLTLVEPLPAVPSTGSAFQGVEVDMAVAAISQRDLNYRAVVRGPTSGQEEVARFDVVYQPWQEPYRAEDARRYISRKFAGNPALQDEERLADIAQKACDRVRLRLRSADRYVHRFFDSDDIMEPCELEAMKEMARQGMLPGGVDPVEYMRQLEFDLKDRIDDLIHSSVPYDQDGDDAMSADEQDGFWGGELIR